MNNENAKGNGKGCIICGEAKDGLPVKEDFVINGIRLIKRYVTRNEKGYVLVVCRECYPKYKKARERMIRRQVVYLVLGFLFAGAFIVLSHDKLSALLYGVIIVLFLYLLSLVNYVPGLVVPNRTAAGSGEQKTAAKVIGKR